MTEAEIEAKLEKLRTEREGIVATVQYQLGRIEGQMEMLKESLAARRSPAPVPLGKP